MFSIRQLEVFLAVAKDESISKAAQSLSMSQSAVSSSLQELEYRYDIQLFDRSGKRLKLNKLGYQLRGKAEVLMTQVKVFDQELKGYEEAGHLHFGASFTIGNYLAVKYLAAYTQKYPDAEVNFQVSSTQEVIKNVLNFDLDMGLIEAEIRHEELILEPWREDQMLIFCSQNHPLATSKPLSDKDLIAATWVLREPSSGARQTFDRAMQGILPNLNIGLELTHNEAIKSAVKEGLGIGCLSKIAIAEEIEAGIFVPLSVPHRVMNRHFYFVTHKHSGQLTSIKKLKELVIELS